MERKRTSRGMFENLVSQLEQVEVREFEVDEFAGVATGSDGTTVIAAFTLTGAGGGDARVSWTAPFLLAILKEVIVESLNQM